MPDDARPRLPGLLVLNNADDAKVLVDHRPHVLLAKHVADAIDRFMRDRAADR